MASTFIAYIDESGDEGFSERSSEWFILSGVITRRATDLETVKLIDRTRTLLGIDTPKPIHFQKLKHHRRLPYIDAISHADLRTVSVITHKRSVAATTLAQKDRMYRYATRYLLERVSWYCRENRLPGDSGDGTVEVIFSHRHQTPYVQLLGYLRHLQSCETRIHWPALNLEAGVAVFQHKERRGLQIADAVCGAVHFALTRDVGGFTEDRYIRMLRPVVYFRGRYLSYGLKFIPEITPMLETEARFRWFREGFR